MELLKEQIICVHFSFKVGKTATETHNVLHEAYSDDALSQTMTHKWFKCFNNGERSTDDDEQSGRPSRSETPIAQVNNIIPGNHQLTD
jgi:hypothetical protein